MSDRRGDDSRSKKGRAGGQGGNRSRRDDGGAGQSRSGQNRSGQNRSAQNRAGKGPSRSATRPDRSGAATPSAPADARAVALAVLTAVRERDAYANLALPAELRRARLDTRDAALATELCYGTLRASGLLDRIIALAADRDVSSIDPPVLDILRLGAYQLLYTRIADHAAVDTSVEAARAAQLGKAGGFVNAVLRKISGQSAEEWIATLRAGITDPVERLAVGTAHPEWIVRAFANALGEQAGELPKLLAADDARPVVHLAALPGEITSEELALATGGEPGTLSPYAVHLESGDPAELDPVRERLARVQDEGSQLVALACADAPIEGNDGGRWLDLCAGPGGKAALLGAIAGIDGAHLDAVEVSEHRAKLVSTATDGLPVTVHVADGRDPKLEPGYDRILVDAPCSGLGSLRRRPESRWRRSPDDVRELTTLQRELLESALSLVRPGGVVLYATCSPHLAETVSIVDRATRRSDVEALDLRDVLPGVADAGPGPWLQLWPHRHGTDAMFLAALRRTS